MIKVNVTQIEDFTWEYECFCPICEDEFDLISDWEPDYVNKNYEKKDRRVIHICDDCQSFYTGLE